MDTSALQVFQLDEYVEVSEHDRRSLFRWMQRSLLASLAIPEERTIRLRGDAADLDAACREYDLAVDRAGGIDLAILGLGPNGHLGFNEPPSAPTAPTRVVTLTPESLRSNAAYWGAEEDVPRRALTAGMTVLLAARRIVLLVSGEKKREIFRRALHGQITPQVPASYLQTHSGCTVIADRAAAECADR
jgi:glucosamine-6-phosphate deaminase